MADRMQYSSPKNAIRETLYRKLEQAPQAHVEALLEAYEVLQLLSDNGILQIAKGVLGSGGKLMEFSAETLESDSVITVLRNLTSLVKILGGVDPKVLEDLQRTLIQNAEEQKSKSQKPPGLFRLASLLISADSRRTLSAIAAALQTIGANLRRGTVESPALLGKNRKKVTRHN